MTEITENQEHTEFDSALDAFEARANRSVLIAIVIAGLIFLAYFFRFMSASVSNDPSGWGQFGDYVGGIMNPVISGLALYWVTQSIVMQKKELHATRKSLRESAFSQERQARSFAIASKLQFINLQVESIDSQISAKQAYQIQILQTVQTNGKTAILIDKSGAEGSYPSLLKEIENDISVLTTARKRFLSAAEKVDPAMSHEISLLKTL